MHQSPVLLVLLVLDVPIAKVLVVGEDHRRSEGWLADGLVHLAPSLGVLREKEGLAVLDRNGSWNGNLRHERAAEARRQKRGSEASSKASEAGVGSEQKGVL